MFLEAYMIGDDWDMNDILSSVSDNVSTRFGVGDGSDPRTLPYALQHAIRGMGLVRLVRQYMENRPSEDFPLLVKTHNANLMPNGHVMLPEALTKKTVHIIRDPRDIVSSMSKHMGKDIDTIIEEMSNDFLNLSSNTEQAKMADFVSSWKHHTKSFVEGDLINSKTFRYEDMQENPVGEFSAILRHIGLPVDEARVKYALDMVELDKLRAREKKEGFKEASKHNPDGFFGQGGSRWKDKLKPYQIKRIEKIAGHWMKEFGYLGSRLVAA